MSFISNLGEQMAGQAAGGIMGMALGAFNDKRQQRQQEKLQEIQMRGQKQMMDYSYAKQLQMWHDTNYGAQVGELNKAGLNPALIYGMSGGGGTTTGNAATSISGANANQNPGEAQSMAGMGLQSAMQLQLLEAQKRVMETQADKNAAEAEKTRGIDTQNLEQDTDNKRQTYELQKLEITLRNIQNFEAQASQGNRLDYIEYQTKTAMKALEIAENDATVSSATVEDKIKTIRHQAIESVLKNELTKAQTGQTSQLTEQSKAQITKWATEITQQWEQLDINQKNTLINKFNAEMKANFPGMNQTLGRILNDGIESIFKITNQERGSHYKQK